MEPELSASSVAPDRCWVGAQPEIRKRRLVGAAQWSPDLPPGSTGKASTSDSPVTKTGIWEKIFQVARPPDNRYVMIDSTIVRVHQQAVCGKGGAGSAPGVEHQDSSGGRCSGPAGALSLTGGQKADVSQAIPLLPELSSLTRGMRATACWTLSGTSPSQRPLGRLYKRTVLERAFTN